MTGLEEVFFANGKVDEDGDPNIIWKTILTPGRLELTPGPNGKKVKKPLTIVEGHSDDPEIIGLQDLLDSYEDGAIQHVTIPTSHSNSVLENTGYIRGLRMVEEDGKNVLKGGFEFKDPEVHKKVKLGTIANVSCGILRNYERQRDGKPFKAVIDHVALTNKPWVDGMTPFSEHDDAAGFYFAEQVDLARYNQSASAPYDYTAHGVEEINPGDSSIKWDNSGSMLARRHNLDEALVEQCPGCALIDFTPTRVLVEDNDQMYITGYTTADDGSITIHPRDEWLEYSPQIEGLSEDQKEKEGGKDPMDEVLLAERDELATKLAEAEERARSAEERIVAAEATTRKTEREAAAKERVRELSALGLSGFPGFLNAVEEILLADEGTVALNLSENGTDKEYTATDIINRLVEALPKKDDKINFGEQHSLIENDVNPLQEEKPKTAAERGAEQAEWLGLNDKKTVLS